MSEDTLLIGVAIVAAAIIASAALSLPFVIAHKAVITRRQLKLMARALERFERGLHPRLALQQASVAQGREAYAFLVAFRSRARFLRWLYWLAILTIPMGWGLLILAIWALEYSDFATAVRAATGSKPKALAQELCAEIERCL